MVGVEGGGVNRISHAEETLLLQLLSGGAFSEILRSGEARAGPTRPGGGGGGVYFLARFVRLTLDE